MISFSIYGSMTVKAVCGTCGDSVASSFKVDKDSITTGNTTQRAAYHLEQHERSVRAQMQSALWDEDKCGRCRIAEAEKHRGRASSPAKGGQ